MLGDAESRRQERDEHHGDAGALTEKIQREAQGEEDRSTRCEVLHGDRTVIVQPGEVDSPGANDGDDHGGDQRDARPDREGDRSRELGKDPLERFARVDQDAAAGEHGRDESHRGPTHGFFNQPHGREDAEQDG